MATWDSIIEKANPKYFHEYLKPKINKVDCSGYCVGKVANLQSAYSYKKPIEYEPAYKKGYEQGVDDYDKGLTPVRIIYNPPATIVFWADGDKTVVKCSKSETYNKYHGFCAALAKRVVGNNSQLMKIVESGFVEGKLPDKCDICVKPEKKKKSKETKKK